jgi:hypothetical protein
MKPVVIRSLAILPICVAMLGGCRRKPAAENSAPPAPPAVALPQPQEASAEQAAAPPPATPTETTATAAMSGQDFQTSVELSDLNKELGIFIFQQKRLPASIGELAKINRCPIPKPPPGYQLVIDKQAKAIRAVPDKK